MLLAYAFRHLPKIFVIHVISLRGETVKIPKPIRLALAAAVVMLAVGAVSVANARGGGGGGGGSTVTSINGTVRTIDVGKKNITIQTSVGTSVKLAVGKSTAITRNGARSALADLTLNDSVTAQYRVSRLSATTLAASGPAVVVTSGKARAVSVAGGTLSIGAQNLQTNANTRISRNGQLVALGQITLRDTLVAHSTVGTTIALDVLADGPNETKVQGVITAIVGSTVTIAPDNGSAPVNAVVGVDTQIEVNDATGALSDLAVGQAVEAEYDPATLVAFSISASSESEDAEVEGTVAAVDPTAGTVTITPKDGGPDITLTVNASTEIEVNDEGGALMDIQIGMPINAEFDVGSLLASEIKAGGSDD